MEEQSKSFLIDYKHKQNFQRQDKKSQQQSEEGNIKNRKIFQSQKQVSSSASQNKKSQSTPQFPFNKWQIRFYITFLIIIVIICVQIYQSYVYRHFDQIKTSFKRSWLSDLIQKQVIFKDNSIQLTRNSSQLNLVQILNYKVNIYRYSFDPQWQAYRDNLWILILTALSWKFITYLAYLFDKIICVRKTYINAQNQFKYVNSYIFVFSFFVLLFSFRADIVFYLSIILVWYLYVEMLIKIRTLNIKFHEELKLKRYNNRAIVSMWIIMLFTLYFNEKYQHFRFLSEWFETFIPESLEILKNSFRAIHCSQLLNMTFLRLLSYGINRIHQADRNWVQKEGMLVKKRMIPCNQCQIISCQNGQNKSKPKILYCYKGRDHIIKTTHDLKDYLNYTLFTPLLFTGPPISYNNFYSYQIHPSTILTLRKYLYHIFLIFTFEVYQHLFPVVNPHADMTLIQLQLFSLMHLFFIWYKFLIIWRTAKIWAEMYGVNVIDNMSRCILNNYGFEGFWRMWHRGFNQWLIRYLYIPLGGNKNTLVAVLCTVAFVAFWHDHTINIVFWALIIALLMVPQILIKRYFRSKHSNLFKKHWFKYFSALVSAIYIYFLIICNLIGFGYGVDKMGLVVDKLFSNVWGLVWSIFVIMSGCMVMFYKRNLEGNVRNY